jgi:oligopeptide transport system permease protein
MSDQILTDNPTVAPEIEPRNDHAQSSLARDAWNDMRRNPVFLLSATVVVLMLIKAAWPGLFAGWFGSGDPRQCDLTLSNNGPATGHPFGFDTQGCDVYSNVIYGASASISVGLLVTLFCFVLAVVLGSVSGFFGGWYDAVISRISDVFFGFPFLLGSLILLTSFSERSIWTVSFVLALLGWPTLARLMRSTVKSVIDVDYVLAARGLGASNWRIISRHILPNAVTPVIVLSTLNIGAFIVAEATLTFLGVGLQYPAISWGLQLSAAQSSFTVSPHLLIFPSLFLGVTVLSFVLLGDVVRDAFDPKLR